MKTRDIKRIKDFRVEDVNFTEESTKVRNYLTSFANYIATANLNAKLIGLPLLKEGSGMLQSIKCKSVTYGKIEIPVCVSYTFVNPKHRLRRVRIDYKIDFTIDVIIYREGIFQQGVYKNVSPEHLNELWKKTLRYHLDPQA